MNKLQKILNPYNDILLSRELLVKELLESENGLSFVLKKNDLKVLKIIVPKTKESKISIFLKNKKLEDYYRSIGIFCPNYFNFKRTNSKGKDIWDQDLRPLIDSSVSLTNFSLLEKEDKCLSLYINNQLVPFSLNFFDIFFDVLDTGFLMPENEYNQFFHILLEQDNTICIKKRDNWNPLRTEFYKDQFYCNQTGFLKEYNHLIYFVEKDDNSRKTFIDNYLNYIHKYKITEEDIYIQKHKLDIEFVSKNIGLFSDEKMIQSNLMFMKKSLKKIENDLELVKNEYNELLKKLNCQS